MQTHNATPESRGKVYEYCECGAVRHHGSKGYEQWHVCQLCATGAECTKEDNEQ